MIVCDCKGNALVGTSDEQDGMALRLRLLNKVYNILVIGKGGRIDDQMIGGCGFKTGSAMTDVGDKEFRESGRMDFEELEDGFPKCIGSDEGAIEVHADGSFRVARYWIHSLLLKHHFLSGAFRKQFRQEIYQTSGIG